MKNKDKAICLSLFAMLLWGSAIPVVKLTYLELMIGKGDIGNKILLAGIRFFISGLISLIYFAVFDNNISKNQKIDWKFILLLGVIQTSVQYIFYYIGLSNTFGINSSIIQASNSFLVCIFSAILIPQDKINSKVIISLIIGTIGIIITNSSSGQGFNMGNLNGDGFIFIATSINALCTILVRKYAANQNAYILNGFQFLFGSILLLLIGFNAAETSLDFGLKSISLIVYSGFISATTFTIWTLVIQKYSANEFGIYKLFVPIFGSILSVILLGENFTTRLAVGLICVLVSSVILNFNKDYFLKRKDSSLYESEKLI